MSSLSSRSNCDLRRQPTKECDWTEVGEECLPLWWPETGRQYRSCSISKLRHYDTTFSDNPFSALDVRVSEVAFENAFKRTLGSVTRILVTLSLQLLPKVDYITVAGRGVDGRGTCAELTTSGGPFSKFVTGFVTRPGDSPRGTPASDVSSGRTKYKSSAPSVSKQETSEPKLQRSAGSTIVWDGGRIGGGFNGEVCRDWNYLFPSLTLVFVWDTEICLCTAHIGIVFHVFIVMIAVYQRSVVRLVLPVRVSAGLTCFSRLVL